MFVDFTPELLSGSKECTGRFLCRYCCWILTVEVGLYSLIQLLDLTLYRRSADCFS